MAKAIVHCRFCKQAFDRNSLIENVDWIKPSTNMYFHKGCYEKYLAEKKDIKANLPENVWFYATWDYLTKDLKGSFNFLKVQNQWNSFLEQGMKAKGMYFALRYFYSIKKGDLSKNEKGIGIVPHIYTEGCQYWLDRENNGEQICAAIESQIMEQQKARRVVVKRPKEKKRIDASAQLSAIMNMEEG